MQGFAIACQQPVDTLQIVPDTADEQINVFIALIHDLPKRAGIQVML